MKDDFIEDIDEIIVVLILIGIGIFLFYLGAVNYNLGLIVGGILFILCGGAIIAVIILFGGIKKAINRRFDKKRVDN